MDAANAEDNVRWAVYSYHRGYYNEAIRSLELALGFKPQLEKTRFWLGKVLYKSGFEEAALNEWKSLSEAQNPLLKNTIQIINLRRGINRELAEKERLVVNRTLDPAKNYYGFKRPTSIKPRKNGAFFIVAYGSSEVISVNANGMVTDVFKGLVTNVLKSKDALYDHPFDVLEMDDGTFYMTEYAADRIAYCKANGDKIKMFGAKGTGDGGLLGPQYLAMDNQNYLYVTDWGNKRVSKFDKEGTFILTFGSKQAGVSVPSDSLLTAPTGIAVIDDYVFVADKGKKRIAVYDTSGNYLSALGEEVLWGPEGLNVKDRNTLLIADTLGFAEKTRIVELDIEQEKITPLPDPIDKSKRLLSAAFDANNNLVTADFDANKVFILSRMSDLYAGYFAEIQHIDSVNFPEVTVDIAVEDRYGNPIFGLEKQNFIINETTQPVSNIVMYNPVSMQPDSSVVVLVEKSPTMEKQKAELKKALETILTQIGNTNLTVVSANEIGEIDVEGKFGKMETVNKVAEGKYSPNWHLDSGIRIAATKLLPSRFRRAIIYVSSGKIGSQPFKDYSLLEIRQLLRNNYISFSVINLGSEGIADDLLYLCNETKGDYYPYYNPEGILQLMKNIRKKADPRYILKYKSNTYPDFGNKYIELNIEVIANKISGKDVLGYYAPLQ